MAFIKKWLVFRFSNFWFLVSVRKSLRGSELPLCSLGPSKLQKCFVKILRSLPDYNKDQKSELMTSVNPKVR